MVAIAGEFNADCVVLSTWLMYSHRRVHALRDQTARQNEIKRFRNLRSPIFNGKIEEIRRKSGVNSTHHFSDFRLEAQGKW